MRAPVSPIVPLFLPCRPQTMHSQGELPEPCPSDDRLSALEELRDVPVVVYPSVEQSLKTPNGDIQSVDAQEGAGQHPVDGDCKGQPCSVQNSMKNAVHETAIFEFSRNCVGIANHVTENIVSCNNL